MDNLNKPYNPAETEEKIYQKWENSGFFNPDCLSRQSVLSLSKDGKPKTFCIVVPPPNITGSLHLGHALNATIQDILIRKKRMEGCKALWIPGTDHAGIATQNVVEKMLRKENISRHDLGREEFIKKVWEWRKKYGNIILDQFKKLGSSMDWSRLAFTMDPGYQKAVSTAFIHYYKQGWIYRGERTINWCTRCATGLSDLEVEHKEEAGKFYYIKYGPLTLGTVRPETKLGDTALAVNPKDSRYKKYVNQEITIQSVDSSVPREEGPKLKDIKIKVIADEAADPDFGTGVIKVTPAHDLTDFEIYQRHPEIPIMQVIGPDGRMTEKAGLRYRGLKVTEARTQIVTDMQKLGLLEKIEDYKHNLALCYRCGSVIEPLPSKQWFVKMDKLAQLAIKTVKSGKVKFHPKRWEKIYFDWLENIKDWCISRQIWWGHQLPVYFCKQEVISNFQFPISKQIQNSKLKIEESHFVVSEKKPEKCPFCKNCEMEQSADVLDTWFSSALWPFATLGWPASAKATVGKPSDLETFYPTQVLSTARDIINLWVSRMIYSGLEFTKKIPFSDVLIHATILTKDGKRMSKSLGTGIDPMDLIAKYGADATRFGLIWQSLGGQDIHWSEEHVMAGKKFANKIWNAIRFVLGAQNGKSEIRSTKSETSPKSKILKFKNSTTADKEILKKLSKIEKSTGQKIDKYEFGPALHDLYDFFWHDFCDKYIECAKLQIAEGKKPEETKEILLHVLVQSLKLLHPFMPFVTEKIWENIPAEEKKLLIIEKWPS